MNYKSKLFISLSISFILLIISLYLSSNSIDATSHMIQDIENKQLKFSHLALSLEHSVEAQQSDILQSIILKEDNLDNDIHNSFYGLYKRVDTLDNFISDNKIDIAGINKIMSILKKRMIAYKLVETSLMEALSNKESEDIEDALIGFNSVTVKFSEDINKLIILSNENLNKNIELLKNSNINTKKDIFYSFFIAMILILFTFFKLTRLQVLAQQELKRAEKAEQEQIKLQSQLLKYNEDLEDEIVKKTAELHLKIYTHFLSELPNRNRLLEDSYIYKFKQMALLNIDKFQKFNDVYGEEVGNIALKLTADFLTSHINDDNTLLYHIGGDEFVVAVKDSTKLNNTYFIEKIENILKLYKKEIFLYEDKTFTFMMSAGLAFSGSKKMLAYADMALKDAKKRNIQLSIFNDDKGLEKIHKQDIECHKKLMYAFESENIISYFQPIAPIQDNSLPIKYESLVRLRDDDGNIIPPLKFIDVAKQNRVYYKLTQIIVNNTLDTISKYNIPCSINISIDDIENDRTLQMLYTTFDEFEHNNLLTIELLETEEFKDYNRVYDFCIKVRSYGIKIALDDFGAGYSNFSHVLNLPIDYIKIDASLISNIDRDTYSQIMVETIVGLAHKLNIQTIAEFVSSKEILDVVKRLKVDYAQGYHIGKPENIKNHIPYLLD